MRFNVLLHRYIYVNKEMDWQNILNKLGEIKTTFDKSSKCIGQNQEVQHGTLHKHAQILVEFFNEAHER